MNFTLECEQEEDGRRLAEVLELLGALAYGGTKDGAMAKAEALALRVLAEWRMGSCHQASVMQCTDA